MQFRRREILTAGMAAGTIAIERPSFASDRPYRRIATEEGFSIPEVDQANAAPGSASTMNAARIALRDAVQDIGAGRIAGMDAAGIDVQLLLLSAPGVQALEPGLASDLARLTNDRAAAAIAEYPDRLAALAAIAPQSPKTAAVELERAVTKLRFKGAIINSHTRGEYLDDEKFWPIFEAAQALDVPIYIHPREPSFGMPGPLAMSGLRIGWGYGVETATHILRIILSGAFDTFPKLRIVVGHLGEMIPFYFDRIDNRLLWESNLSDLKVRARQLPSRYFQENIYLTTSGVNYWTPVQYTIARVGIDRVLFAVDHPYEDQPAVVAAAESFPLVGMDRQKFFQTNAERVFKI